MLSRFRAGHCNTSVAGRYRRRRAIGQLPRNARGQRARRGLRTAAPGQRQRADDRRVGDHLRRRGRRAVRATPWPAPAAGPCRVTRSGASGACRAALPRVAGRGRPMRSATRRTARAAGRRGVRPHPHPAHGDADVRRSARAPGSGAPAWRPRRATPRAAGPRCSRRAGTPGAVDRRGQPRHQAAERPAGRPALGDGQRRGQHEGRLVERPGIERHARAWSARVRPGRPASPTASDGQAAVAAAQAPR